MVPAVPGAAVLWALVPGSWALITESVGGRLIQLWLIEIAYERTRGLGEVSGDTRGQRKWGLW